VERPTSRPARSEPDEGVDAFAHQVIGAAIEVHKHLGPGYIEGVYEDALVVELILRGIPFEQQKIVGVNYKGHEVGQSRLDLVVAGCLVVEIKAVTELAPIHKAQVISYLKATGLTLGLLINFNVPVLKDGIRRVILS
jgi:GxxExxY protein